MHHLNIRKAEAVDAQSLSGMICQTAENILKPHYSDSQWLIFIRYYSVEAILKKIETQVVFCAEMDNVIISTVALEGDFVVGFYTRLAYIGQGIGQKLMQHLEKYAKSLGLKELQLAASPEGLKFYYKNGWDKVKDFTIDHYGVGFEETLMVKKIV